MPYIPQAAKDFLESEELRELAARTSGELNYQLTMVVVSYLLSKGLCYDTCNDIAGALSNCLDEFRRRVQHPYEDKKRAENGDVYPEEVLS